MRTGIAEGRFGGERDEECSTLVWRRSTWEEDSVRKHGEAGPAKARPPPRRETTDIHGVDREKTVGEKRDGERERERERDEGGCLLGRSVGRSVGRSIGRSLALGKRGTDTREHSDDERRTRSRRRRRRRRRRTGTPERRRQSSSRGAKATEKGERLFCPAAKTRKSSSATRRMKKKEKENEEGQAKTALLNDASAFRHEHAEAASQPGSRPIDRPTDQPTDRPTDRPHWVSAKRARHSRRYSARDMEKFTIPRRTRVSIQLIRSWIQFELLRTRS
ncbi:hypothetical protein ALC56_08038 [Trachymyrmex septentrionalis]|uniref:Uncharacterized protein n=1 Tax=Trachymyrmex septentrionalis TaxID=34720 RepID=A0A195FCR6_9HYME|nr:hypothetical protein ALC56_08038 [Trachymyrmex septentrionalis]